MVVLDYLVLIIKNKEKYINFINPGDLSDQYEIKKDPGDWIQGKPQDKDWSDGKVRIKEELKIDEVYYPKHEKLVSQEDDPSGYERTDRSNIYKYRKMVKGKNKSDSSFSITDKEANIDLHLPYISNIRCY